MIRALTFIQATRLIASAYSTGDVFEIFMNELVKKTKIGKFAAI